MFKTLKEGFGARLKELRKEKGFTQEKLAEKLDIAPRQLTRLETGVNFPSVETLEKISFYLEADLKSLFDFTWDKEYSICCTGTDDRPVFEVSTNDRVVDLSSYFKKKKNEPVYDLNQLINVQNSDESMLQSARNINKPFTIVYKDANGELSHVKTYYPDGRIDEVMSKEKVETEKVFKELTDEINDIRYDMNKLKFLKLAKASLTSKDAFNELKSLMKGIEIMMDSK